LGEARIEFLDDQPRDGRRLGQLDFEPRLFGLVGGCPARLGIVVHRFVRAELGAARVDVGCGGRTVSSQSAGTGRGERIEMEPELIAKAEG